MFKKKATKQPEVKRTKKTTSVVAVFVFVGIIFLILCGGLFYLRYSADSPLFHFYVPTPDVASVSDTLQKQLDVKTDPSVELKITENQISSAVCLTCDSFPLKKAELVVRPDGISITGKTSTYFWGINVEVTIKPKIENEKVTFDLTDIKAAGVTAPPKIADSISSQLKSLLANVVPANSAVSFKEVYAMVGYILVVGAKK